jgi:acetoin utilization protein AcuB
MKAENLLLVHRVMKFMPWTVQPSDSVAHARALLDEQRINNLPVISKGKLVGVVSAHDLQASTLSPKAHANKRDLAIHPDRVRVASVMTTTVQIARPKDTLAAAAALMRREHVGALPVMEGDHLRGIINRSDIIATLSALRRNPSR